MADLSILTTLPIWVLGIGLFLVYVVGLSVQRLYFSPIADFPGPKLAALTFWYEFYHDVIRGGQYTFKIGELHDQYGKCADTRAVRENRGEEEGLNLP